MWRLSVQPIGEELAIAAARIKAERRMGYLDCFVVALAQQLNATVLTGDPDFRRVEDLVRIEWLER
jgi:ribonuclease VapC